MHLNFFFNYGKRYLGKEKSDETRKNEGPFIHVFIILN